MIIKKFQIPCPLPEDVGALNETQSRAVNSSVPAANGTAVYYNDACTPKYFVFNSQVGAPAGTQRR